MLKRLVFDHPGRAVLAAVVIAGSLAVGAQAAPIIVKIASRGTTVNG